MSSRSQSCLSERTIAGSFSASSYSSFLRGASRAIKSLRMPPVVPLVSAVQRAPKLRKRLPCGGFAMISEGRSVWVLENSICLQKVSRFMLSQCRGMLVVLSVVRFTDDRQCVRRTSQSIGASRLLFLRPQDLFLFCWPIKGSVVCKN
jgi:hypothetical protein